MVIGSPAEESGGGKAFLVERGAFHDIDAALIAHPATKTYVASRALAWEPLRITFRGADLRMQVLRPTKVLTRSTQ